MLFLLGYNNMRISFHIGGGGYHGRSPRDRDRIRRYERRHGHYHNHASTSTSTSSPVAFVIFLILFIGITGLCLYSFFSK